MHRYVCPVVALFLTSCATASSDAAAKTAYMEDEGSIHVGSLKITNSTCAGVKFRVKAESEFKGNLDSKQQALQKDVKVGNKPNVEGN